MMNGGSGLLHQGPAVVAAVQPRAVEVECGGYGIQPPGTAVDVS